MSSLDSLREQVEGLPADSEQWLSPYAWVGSKSGLLTALSGELIADEGHRLWIGLEEESGAYAQLAEAFKMGEGRRVWLLTDSTRAVPEDECPTR